MIAHLKLRFQKILGGGCPLNPNKILEDGTQQWVRSEHYFTLEANDHIWEKMTLKSGFCALLPTAKS